MSKRMEKQRKKEKRNRKTEKELNLDLDGTLATAQLCSQYLSYDGCQYLGYDGCIIGGTWPMDMDVIVGTWSTVGHGWYSDYKRSIVDMPGT